MVELRVDMIPLLAVGKMQNVEEEAVAMVELTPLQLEQQEEVLYLGQGEEEVVVTTLIAQVVMLELGVHGIKEKV